jgi:hypothetical protein
VSERLPDGGIQLSPAEIEALDARYLVPELVLLFKAKATRPKDQADFEATIPHMTATQRGTLAELLTRVHPHHHWLTDL